MVMGETEKTNKVGKPYKHLQSQGYIKMAYCCSKFNAFSLHSWKKEENRLKK